MNNRIRLGLLLLSLLSLSLAGTATAQVPQRGFPGRLPQRDKPSHRDLPGGFDLSNAEQMMAQRLQELHELHQLQDRVQDLVNDPKLREQLEKLGPEEREKLREKLLNGKGLKGDPNWESLLSGATSGRKFDDRQIDMLRRLAERGEFKPPPTNENGLLPNRGSETSSSGSAARGSSPVANAPGSPTLPNTTEPEPSLYDRMQEKATKWMIDNFENVGGDVVSALTELRMNDGNTPLAELMRSMQQPDFGNLNVSERTMGLSRYLSNAGDFLHRQRGAWDEVQSIFRKAPVPSLPNLGVPSAAVTPSSPAGGDSWTPTLLSLLLLGTIVLLLCLRTLSMKAQPDSSDRDEWRLGSWPVAPGRVSTRQDVIRAFEYLALLCLGPAAGVCHHRELAERLAQQDSVNPARRQAAEMLAWLYEQARYAPAGEALSREQISDARHALCMLAGVTAL